MREGRFHRTSVIQSCRRQNISGAEWPSLKWQIQVAEIKHLESSYEKLKMEEEPRSDRQGGDS